MKIFIQATLAVIAALSSTAGFAQAEGVNVKLNRSADISVQSLGLGPAGQVILNVPECAGLDQEIISSENGYATAISRTCGRIYTMYFKHGELVDFRVQEDVRR